jgi:hypothetical protein
MAKIVRANVAIRRAVIALLFSVVIFLVKLTAMALITNSNTNSIPSAFELAGLMNTLFSRHYANFVGRAFNRCRAICHCNTTKKEATEKNKYAQLMLLN